MKNEKYIICLLLIIILLVVSGCNIQPNEKSEETYTKTYKIFFLQSYNHIDWGWGQDMLNGFETAFGDENVILEVEIFEMDTKRKSSSEWIENISRQAKERINEWKPDLIFAIDDNAQKYVVMDYINTSTPIVFAGVNNNPEDYNYVGSTNIAGVLEREHIIPTLNLLKEIDPGIKKIAAISDTGPTWVGVIKRIRESEDELEDMEIINYHRILKFEEFKEIILGYQDEVDALLIMSAYLLKDENDENVPLGEAIRWTVENSNLPDACFVTGQIEQGTLTSVVVSPYEQGYSAGKIARGILIDGNSPMSYGFKLPYKGKPVINIKRANKMGLEIKSDILLKSKVIDYYEWEKE